MALKIVGMVLFSALSVPSDTFSDSETVIFSSPSMLPRGASLLVDFDAKNGSDSRLDSCRRSISAACAGSFTPDPGRS